MGDGDRRKHQTQEQWKGCPRLFSESLIVRHVVAPCWSMSRSYVPIAEYWSCIKPANRHSQISKPDATEYLWNVTETLNLKIFHVFNKWGKFFLNCF
jgi:hypothetical protein